MSFRQGARQFFERRGAPTPSVPTARDYVQDGLIAMWDGIENAGWGVHDANATTWKDLVGERDLNCVNVTFDGTWAVFAGDGYATIVENGYNRMQGENRTMEACFKTTTNMNNMDVVNIVNTDYPGNGYFWRLCISGYSDRIIVANGRNISNSAMFTRDLQQLADGATFSVLAYQSSIVGAFWNGNAAVASGTEYRTAGTNGVTIGGANTTTRLFTGRVGCVRCYSRALSAAEIAANYAIDKARFNLP